MRAKLLGDLPGTEHASRKAMTGYAESRGGVRTAPPPVVSDVGRYSDRNDAFSSDRARDLSAQTSGQEGSHVEVEPYRKFFLSPAS